MENREENQSSAETRPELPQTGTQAAPPEVKPISPPLKTAEAPPTTPAVAVPATPSAVSDDEWQATADRADEENWEDTGEHPLLDDGGSWSLPETTAAPVSHSLAELTEMLPESTRDALDHYLRGKFISVTKLDRSRLL